jgi:hypothetical protein
MSHPKTTPLGESAALTGQTPAGFRTSPPGPTSLVFLPPTRDPIVWTSRLAGWPRTPT